MLVKHRTSSVSSLSNALHKLRGQQPGKKTRFYPLQVDATIKFFFIIMRIMHQIIMSMLNVIFLHNSHLTQLLVKLAINPNTIFLVCQYVQNILNEE